MHTQMQFSKFMTNFIPEAKFNTGVKTSVWKAQAGMKFP